MKATKILAVAGVLIAGVVGSVQAATYPTFVVDESASSISLTQVSLGTATLDAEFSAGVDGYSWTPTSANDSVKIDNLIDWTPSGIGIGAYNVQVDLAFSSPDPASSTSTGGGFFGTFFGIISAGVLSWTGTSSVTFAQGSTLDVIMEGGAGVFFGSVSTGVKLVGNQIAPIPLPATGLLLLTALGGVGLVGRRRRKLVA